ncbi:MAG: hypothetical protein ACOYCE_09105 [Limnochordia bacterium]
MKRLIIVLIITLCPFLYGSTSQAQIVELHAGVDVGELVAGGTYSINEQLSAMVEYYEKSGVGLGVFFDQGSWRAHLIHRPMEWEAQMFSRALGHLRIKADEEIDETSGSLSLRLGNIVATGSYADKPERIRGAARIGYRSPNTATALQWRMLDEGERQDNYILTQTLTMNKHTLEASYQNNEYAFGSSSLVGEGFELLWTPPWDFLRIGTGQFHETNTDVTDWRHRVRVQKELTHQVGQTLFGLGGGIEGFFYGGGDRREEIAVTGRIRQSWTNGYGEIGVKRIQRSGTTPFEFDLEDELDYLGHIILNQKVGRIESNLRVNYDILDEEWKRARGTVDIALTDSLSGTFIADYDLDEEPELDQSTFMTQIRYHNGMDIRAGADFNYVFDPLTLFARCSLPIADDRLGVEVSYDWEESQLESIKGTYDFDGSRRISLEYNPVRPKIMLGYRTTAW